MSDDRPQLPLGEHAKKGQADQQRTRPAPGHNSAAGQISQADLRRWFNTEAPANQELGVDPETGQMVTLRNGRFGDYVQLGEGEKPKRASLPKGLAPADVTLEKALKLLSLPREVAKHPDSGEPIVAGLGRYGPYVQHGKTYASLGKDDDVLEIGGNRAIDLIVAKESGASSRFGSSPGRALGDHPEGGLLAAKDGYLYGTTANGGGGSNCSSVEGCGTVYKVKR